MGFSWSQLKMGTLKRVWTWDQKPRSQGKSPYLTYRDKGARQEERTQNRNYFHHRVISLRLSNDDLLLFEHAGLIFNDFELIV